MSGAFPRRRADAIIAAMNQWLRLALDLGPLLIFFFVNARAGLLAATGAFMAAIVVSLAVTYWIERRVPRVPLVLAAFVLVFGGLTLALGDETFIKMKPTAINALFAVVLFASLVFRRNLLKVAFQEAFTLDDGGWRVLTWRWAMFFAAMAVLNEVVWRTQSTDVWVSFKVFGILPLTLAFALAQVPFILRRQPKEKSGDVTPG
jgi:intracellular septation protein